jgi:hypothetical protein
MALKTREASIGRELAINSVEILRNSKNGFLVYRDSGAA